MGSRSALPVSRCCCDAFLQCCSAFLFLVKLLVYIAMYCVCCCEKRGKIERNLTDVTGKITVSFGEDVLERYYACSAEIAQTRNYFK